MISQLEEIKTFFENEQSEREEKFSDKSDKWQESENGEAYAEITGTMEEVVNETDSLIDKLTELYPED